MINIYLLEDCDGKQYVGSTKRTLNHRFRGHKVDKKRNRNCTSSQLNLEQTTYTLLEKCNECERSDREGYWISQYNCVNERKLNFDPKIYDQTEDRINQKRTNLREWRNKNKEHYNEYMRQYRLNQRWGGLLTISKDLFL